MTIAAIFIWTTWIAMPASAFPSDGPPDACGLLPRTDIERAAGTQVGEGKPHLHIPSVTSCVYTGAGGARVAIFIRRIDRPEWAADQVRRMERGVRLGTYRETTGIGGRSFFLDAGKASSVLCVFHDDLYLQISQVRSGNAAANPLDLERLARKALIAAR
jgi:hypothetical protein